MKTKKSGRSAIQIPNVTDGIFEKTLDNALKIFVYPKQGVGTVHVSAYVRTGSTDEGEDLGRGLSHFLEHMAFTGCKDYPGETEIADKVNSLGGRLNAYTSYAETSYYVDVPSEYAGEAVKMVSSMLSSPLFPEKLFEREKEVILRECAMVRDNVIRAFYSKMLADTFRSHPMRIPVIGLPEKIAEVNRDVMVNYYERRYSPMRTFFVVTGDVVPDEIFLAVEKRLGKWRCGRVDEVVKPLETIRCRQSRSTSYFNDPLAFTGISFVTPGTQHRDMPTLDVIAEILGGSDSSRIVNALSVKRKIAPASGVWAVSLPDVGAFSAWARTREENAAEAEKVLAGELDRIRTEKVSEEELEKVRATVTANAVRDMENHFNMASKIASAVLATGGVSLLETYPAEINAITQEDVMDAAKKYLSLSSSSVTSQLPLRKEAKKAGPKSSDLKKKRKNEIKRTVLPDSQKVLFLRDDTLPMVNVSIMLQGGFFRDEEGRYGTSNLIADALCDGCKGLSEEQFNGFLDKRAITFDVSSDDEAICITLNCLTKYFSDAVGILRKVLSSPTFGKEEFERDRRDACDELSSRMLLPLFSAENKAMELLFKDHPAGVPSGKVLEAMKKVTGKYAKKFYSENVLVPSKVCAGISGNLTQEEAIAAVRSVFSGVRWSRTKKTEVKAPKLSGKAVTSSKVIDKEQSAVVLAIPLGECDGEGIAYHSILYSYLGGMSSPIFKKVREDAALAYSASGRLRLYNSFGILYFEALVKPKCENAVAKIFVEEAKRLRTNGIDKKSFDAAKAGAIFVREAFVFASASSLVRAATAGEFFGLGFDAPFVRMEQLRKITLDGFNAYLKKLFSSPSAACVAVSPEKIDFFPPF